MTNNERNTIPQWHPDQNDYLARRIEDLKTGFQNKRWYRRGADGKAEKYSREDLAKEIYNHSDFDDKSYKLFLLLAR